MSSFFKRSIKRRFLFVMMVVFILALTGIMIILSVAAATKEQYSRDREYLIDKQGVVKEIESHYMQMIMKERGFIAFQSYRDLQASYKEASLLKEALHRFQLFDLTEEEKRVSQELVVFTDDFTGRLLPLLEKHILENDYYAIREISQSGTTDTVYSFLNYMEMSEAAYDQALNDTIIALSKKLSVLISC